MSAPERPPMLKGAAPAIAVSDFGPSLAYYRDVLGFRADFLWGDPPSYACLCRDEVAVHIVSEQVARRTPGQSAVCIFVDDLDALFAELSLSGAIVLQPPKTYDYGMREFEIADPDRNRLIYGTAVVTDHQASEAR